LKEQLLTKNIVKWPTALKLLIKKEGVLMKKIMVALVAGVISFASIQAHAEMSVMDYLKDYGLPCAAGFAGGLLASKDHGGAIGVGVCLGVGTSTYLQSKREAQRMQDEDFNRFMKLMDEHAAKNNAALMEKTDKAISDMQDKQALQLEGIRETMKEVLAERFAGLSEEMKVNARRQMQETGFMEELESETRASQKETVEKVADEVLKQIVMKKVGVPGDQ
jgi:hypothetical protein